MIGENCLKEGAVPGQCADLRGALEEKGLAFFRGGGGVIPQCTL